MDREEVRDIDRDLREILRRRRLGWVVAQVDEEIRIGKVVFKDGSLIDEQRRFPADPGPNRQLQQVVSVAYSTEERLLLLIEAVERAVVSTTLMAEDTLLRLGADYDYGEVEVAFQSDEQSEQQLGNEGTPLSLSAIARKRESAQHLADLLAELKNTVDYE